VEPKIIRPFRRNYNQPAKQTKTDIKQIIGHMIDSASEQHPPIIHLQYHLTLDFGLCQPREQRPWIAIQNYQEENWKNLVQLWKIFELSILPM
jgi:hypothetical protein